MKKISQNEFYETIKDSGNFENIEIDFSQIKLDEVTSLIFTNCNFTHSQILFTDSDFTEKEFRVKKIQFDGCTFNSCLFMKINNFSSFMVLNTKKAKSFKIFNSNIDTLFFENNINIDYKIEISRCQNIDTFYFSKNKFSKNGDFELLDNSFNKPSAIIDNDFNNFNFTRQIFKEFTTFKNTFLRDSISSFNECEFKKVNFNECDFFNLTIYKCDFLSTTWFEKCKNIENSSLKFIACEFKGFSLFNKSKLNILDIDRCTFDKSSSFTDAEFNTLKLFEVKFGGGAYFDEMKINKVLDKSYLKDKTKILDWKRTLRAIKQELQKTENKIDFNRFRGFELAAHYEELGWGWKSGFKDKFILWATKWSTDFGNSWRRSLAFTLLSGLFWYSVFFYFDFYLTGNYQYYFKTNYIGIFSNGYFRFLLVTDFYNPLVEDRTYIQNFWSWIPFIFGKIFVAFGIYEMIQSFRKFKA